MQKSGLITLILLSVSLVIGFLFAWPEFQKIEILRAEKELQETKRDKLERAIANIDESSEKYEQIQNDLEKLSFAIPSDPEVPEVLIQLEEMINRNGLILGDINFSVASFKEEDLQINEIRKVNFKMVAEGSYSNFKKLLNDIEENVRLMDVVALNFGQVDKESGFPKFEISLNAYYLDKR